MKHKKALFVFRRDLRLHDNTGLIAALQQSEAVVPVFIFDPRQIKNNQYRSDNAVQFMIASLNELDSDIRKKGARLHFFFGEHEKVIPRLVSKHKIDAVFINRDYTPYSRKRDDLISKKCNLLQFGDVLLHEPEEVLKGDGSPYSIFTPFYKKASKIKVRIPVRNNLSNYLTIKDEGTMLFSKVLKKNNPDIYRKGGRSEAVRILKDIKEFKNYKDVRDYPAVDGTTGLSAHNKFGTVSIREVYHSVRDKLGFHHALLRELHWRDFFTHICFHFPYVLGHSFRKKYGKIKWDNNPKLFKAWCEGRTGFPIVDAGMRQLNSTGFMHNRVRMVVASFLVKDLWIDWRKGEKYFAQKLVDYDPSVNNGNWQWSASTGADAQPFFRIFNPWSQQLKFDPKCEYIKKWVPELSKLSVSEIHDLEKGRPDKLRYPSPIVDHSSRAKAAVAMFRKSS